MYQYPYITQRITIKDIQNVNKIIVTYEKEWGIYFLIFYYSFSYTLQLSISFLFISTLVVMACGLQCNYVDIV